MILPEALPRVVSLVLVDVGVAAAIFCVFFAQRAWKGWSGPTPVALGVGLAAALAMTAGIVAVFLIAAIPKPVP